MRKIEKMVPCSYHEALGALDGRQSRKLTTNTSLHRSPVDGVGTAYVAVRLHATDVVTFYAGGRIKLNSGGWRTVTTKARMNAALANSKLSIYQEKGDWYIVDRELHTTVEYADHMIVTVRS